MSLRCLRPRTTPRLSAPRCLRQRLTSDLVNVSLSNIRTINVRARQVALVRLMADGRVEPCVCNVPPIYRSVFHALHRISKEEGLKALWRGGTLTVGRAFFVTMTQLSSYEKLHDVLEHTDLTSGLTLHVCCTLLSTFFTAFISLPVDLVKTRYQVRKCNITQNEIFSEIYKKKGLGYFWKGFVPYYVRLAVQSLLAYMLVHELNYHYKR